MPEEKAPVLLERTKRGETAVFDELLETYQDRIVNTIFRMVGNYEEALDLAQVTFLKAYRGMGNFKGMSRVYTWLYRIAVNTVLSERRKKSTREEAKTVSLDSDAHSGDGGLIRAIPDGEDSPGEKVLADEVRDEVSRVIGELDEEFRTVVVLKDIDGLTYDEIAEILDCPKGTVKSRLHRARTILKEKLKHMV